MKNLHINNSYKIWNPVKMRTLITKNSYLIYKDVYTDKLLNRSYLSMYIEWWLHNIGYYITLPFCMFPKVAYTNRRFRDVDLEEWNKC